MPGYYFNLPQITQLTISQQSALNETGQIALSGGPGTGKSVVSLWRHISNYQNDKKSLLLTFTTTLAKYLRASCAIQNSDAANNVGRSYKDKYRIAESWDEIIIDEAQDLPNDYFRAISNLSYGADKNQSVFDGITIEELKELFPDNQDHVLDKNFRNTKQIMQFAKLAFPNAYITQKLIDSCRAGEKPIMLMSDKNEWDDELGKFNISNDKQNYDIIYIINKLKSDMHNIAILVPFRRDVKAFEVILNENNIEDFSIYYEDDERFPDGCGDIKNVHITTFKSAKGLEFDTVIIPNFHNYIKICGRFNITWKDYYVAVTRARSNLYLISNYDMPQFNNVVEKSNISNTQINNNTQNSGSTNIDDDLPF